MSGFIMLATLLPLSFASSCSTQSSVTLDVRAIHEPVTMASDYSLADLADLAMQVGQKTDHRPLGFYSGSVANEVLAFETSAADSACGSAIHLDVTFHLADRQIQIANDLRLVPCRYETVVRHYQSHASADDIVFGNFARAITGRLDRLSKSDTPPGPQGATALQVQLRGQALQLIEEAMPNLKAERDAARKSVDTSLEVERLLDACSQNL